ncbi:hypothetical protein IWQ61_000577 [Dispira simplex]|nr:hypothetical protein IWQ61_000577 [Dispira simplex]
MKLASFIALGVVATCLSGSVWATGKIFETESVVGFCAALRLRYSLEEYDKTIEPEELEKLRKLAKSEVSTEESEKPSPKDIAGAAKMFLLERMYEKNEINDFNGEFGAYNENGWETRSYRYFIAHHDNELTEFAELKNLNDVKYFQRQQENYVFFKLSNDNPVEAMAADLIDQCDKLRMKTWLWVSRLYSYPWVRKYPQDEAE